MDGECLEGVDVDCGFAFVCDEDTRSCQRDCDEFDIDGFLQCSDTFSAVGDDISTINDELDGMDTSMSGLDGRITTNSGDITSLTSRMDAVEGDVDGVETRIDGVDAAIIDINTRIAGNANDISTLQSEVENHGDSLDTHIQDVHGRIDNNDVVITALEERVSTNEEDIATLSNRINRLSRHYRRTLNGGNANLNPINIDDGSNSFKNNDPSSFTLKGVSSFKDILIIGLLVTNLIMMLYICICSGNNRYLKRGKYTEISQAVSDSETES